MSKYPRVFVVFTCAQVHRRHSRHFCHIFNESILGTIKWSQQVKLSQNRGSLQILVSTVLRDANALLNITFLLFYLFHVKVLKKKFRSCRNEIAN